MQGSWWIARTLNLTAQWVKMVHQTGVSAMYVLICPAKKRTNAVGRGLVVTSYEMFRNVVLDREVLNIAIWAWCDIRAEVADFEMNSYRKAAYRQYILWKYGKLGKGNRRVCPSCVVRLVRQTYPAPDGQYMGFRRHWTAIVLLKPLYSGILMLRKFVRLLTLSFYWLILSSLESGVKFNRKWELHVL